MFLDVFNKVFKAKTSLINDFELVRDKLFTPVNQEALSDLKRELEIVSELIKHNVESGTKEYTDSHLSEYDKYAVRYKDIESKFNYIIKTKKRESKTLKSPSLLMNSRD